MRERLEARAPVIRTHPARADPKKGPYEGGQMDAVVEVDMQGNVVWEWRFFDHVLQDVDPTKPNHVGTGKTIADHPGRINLNLPGRPLKRDWLHCNSLDYSAESGRIVINSLQGELYVIDHDGTFVAGDPKASLAKAAAKRVWRTDNRDDRPASKIRPVRTVTRSTFVPSRGLTPIESGSKTI